jgi:hypothetical protein
MLCGEGSRERSLEHRLRCLRLQTQGRDGDGMPLGFADAEDGSGGRYFRTALKMQGWHDAVSDVAGSPSTPRP